MRSILFKQVMIIFIPLILFVPNITFAQNDSSRIVLTMDKEAYTIAMQVNIVGQVLGSFDPANPVLISVSGEDGNTYHTISIQRDDTGRFTYQFVIGDDASIGMSTLEVMHENIQGEIRGAMSFEVMDKASVTVHTNKTEYKLGDDVVLSGTVSPILPGDQVLIQVFNPKNNAWVFKSISENMITANGQFSIQLGKLDGELSLLGVYTVKASYAASTALGTTTFAVGSESVDASSESNTESSSQSNSNSQTSTPSEVNVEAKESESTSAVAVAKEAVIQSEIENNGTEEKEFTYIVLIKDSEGFTVSLSWASGKLPPSQKKNVEQSWMPEASGIYAVEIFVWESFENPRPLSPVVLKHIVVE